ncbi:hypothetical protein lerEdw1_005247 [Lerista edwardsae]|nr:hypothetical protein lerEdw1_005247 [Lerista edwardsae]
MEKTKASLFVIFIEEEEEEEQQQQQQQHSIHKRSGTDNLKKSTSVAFFNMQIQCLLQPDPAKTRRGKPQLRQPEPITEIRQRQGGPGKSSHGVKWEAL